MAFLAVFVALKIAHRAGGYEKARQPVRCLIRFFYSVAELMCFSSRGCDKDTHYRLPGGMPTA